MMSRYFIYRYNDGTDSAPSCFAANRSDDEIRAVMEAGRSGGEILELDYVLKPLSKPAAVPASKSVVHEPDLHGHVDRPYEILR